jgi:molybdopterin synthase catalytic subunit
MGDAGFRLASGPLPTAPPFPLSRAAGALATFTGVVRDHHDGRAVLRLEYAAYPALAESEGARIVAEAIVRFGLAAAACRHRTGLLAVGDAAVQIWTAATHRREALAGCAYIIDEVKARVPIWKREFYADGTRAWVACAHPAATPGDLHSRDRAHAHSGVALPHRNSGLE